MYVIITSYNVTHNPQIKTDMQSISSNIIMVSENNVQIVIRAPSDEVYNNIKTINNIYNIEETINVTKME